MELLTEDIVPESARAVKQEAREFAEEHVAPKAEEYYESGDYPWEILEAGMDAGLVGQDISEEYGGRGRCPNPRRGVTSQGCRPPPRKTATSTF